MSSPSSCVGAHGVRCAGGLSWFCKGVGDDLLVFVDAILAMIEDAGAKGSSFW